MQPKGVGSYLRTHVGRTPRFDHGKIVRDLGIEFRPLEQTIAETLQDLEVWGHLGAPRAEGKAS
jgi:dihydroflavonol-4-reductase